jgi:hypothetical protein
MRRVLNKNGRAPEVSVKLSRDRVLSHIDSEARKRLGMSARVMLRKYRRGQLRDVGRVADLIVWSDALPDNNPIFEAS